ncbi:MAG: hypothetical protein WC914_01620 [Proteiniphilum sp.]
MKHKIGALYLLLFAASMQAQPQRTEVFHYIFPEFTNGTVLMKNGTENKALLNYNAATEEMIFDQNGKKLALAEVTLNQLDTVFIQGRKFVLLENRKFAEVINKNGYSLLVQYKCRVNPPGKPAAYGGTSQTSSTTSYSSWMGDGRMYDLKLPDDYKINPYMVYWFNSGEKWDNFVSLRQIRRYYSKQKALFNKYTKENTVSFDDAESIANLVHHMETNSR